MGRSQVRAVECSAETIMAPIARIVEGPIGG